MLYFRRIILIYLSINVVSGLNNSSRMIWPNGCGHDWPSQASYCYHTIDDVTYPYNCPYKDVVQLGDYDNLLKKLLENSKFWVNAQQDPEYGYYKWLEIGDNYGKLFQGAEQKEGQCVAMANVIEEFSTDECTGLNVGLCVYPVRRNVKNYCDVFNEICNTDKENCHCQPDRKGFYCESSCTETITSHTCSVCEQKFKEYPTPTINLKLDNDKIVVTVTNSLKLYLITDENVVYCYTDVYQPTATLIRYKYTNSELTTTQNTDDTFIYQFKIRNGGVGHYWCEGFLYPDLEIVQSNTVIAGINTGPTFVLNVTVKLTSEYTFLPYNLHTKTTEIIQKHVLTLSSVRPIEISKLYDNKQKVNLIFHMSSKETDERTMEEIFEIINEDLTSLNNDEQIIDYSLSNTEFCVSETTEINGVEVIWPTVTIGQVATPTKIILQANGLPLTRACEGSYKYGAHWSEINGDIDIDQNVSESTNSLNELLASNKTAQEKNENLNTILLEIEEFTSYDIHLIAEIFKQITTAKENYDFELLTDNLNIVTRIDRDVLAESQDVLNATDSLLYSYDVALSRVSSTNVKRENIIVQVTDLRFEEIIGLALYEENGEITTVALDRSVSLENIERKHLIFATYIPPDLLKQILSVTNPNTNTNLVTAIYLNDALFNDDGEKSSVSSIISMFVVEFQASLLAEAVPIIFEPKISGNSKKHCGYWKYGMSELFTSFAGHWNVDDNAEFNAKEKTCHFDHMTHFALLVGAEEDMVTDYLSSIGGSLTLISVFLIYLTAMISKSWRESAGTKILLNYSTAIAFQMILLIILSLIDPNENESLCRALGMLLHYIVISQFCWALVISYLQYRKFVQVLTNEPPHIVLKSCIFAWGTAVIPVLVSIGINVTNYNYNGICYPSGNYLYIGLYLPVIFIIAVNIFIFVLIFRSVLQKRTSAFGTEKNLVMLKLKLAVILFFLMGFSWIFGLLGSFLNSKVLLYIFCCTNAVQGLVLYMYFVVCNKGTRRLWVKQFKKLTNHKSEKSENKTSSTSQSNLQSKKY